MHEVLRRRATTRKKTGLVPSPQNYSDILHSAENVKRNLKDKLFRLGRDPLVPIWWDVKPIKIITVGLVQGYLPSEAGKEPQKIEDFTLFNSSQTCFPVPGSCLACPRLVCTYPHSLTQGEMRPQFPPQSWQFSHKIVAFITQFSPHRVPATSVS